MLSARRLCAPWPRLSGGSTALALPRGAVPRGAEDLVHHPLCGWETLPSCELPCWGFLWTPPALNMALHMHKTNNKCEEIRIKMSVFSEFSVLMHFTLHSSKQSAAQEVSQWKYVMNYHMECTLQKCKFVLVKGPMSFLHLFLDSFFTQKVLCIAASKTEGERLEIECFPLSVKGGICWINGISSSSNSTNIPFKYMVMMDLWLRHRVRRPGDRLTASPQVIQ